MVCSKMMIPAMTLVFLVACGGGGGDESPSSPSHPTENIQGLAVVADLDPHVKNAVDAEIAVAPTAPTTPGGRPLDWAPAGEMTPLRLVPNQDSATLVLPVVPGAQDYRAIVLSNDITVSSAADGAESILNADIYCAGFRQYNDAARPYHVLMRLLEVAGIEQDSWVVIEAIDKPCPFVGVTGKFHHIINISHAADHLPEADRHPFHVFAEGEIYLKYGSMIWNGHQCGAALGTQGEADAPHVLARSTVKVKPVTEPATDTNFESFLNDSEVPGPRMDINGLPRAQFGKLQQNSQWSFYSFGAEYSEFVINRGQLRMNLADWGQEVFATNFAMPRKTVKIADDDYLHVSFEVASNSTQRRYWWFFMCGDDVLGKTLDNMGRLRKEIVQTPFFYQADGRNPSVAGWNCLQIFPRDGSPFPLGDSEQRPQSDIRVMVNRSDCAQRVRNRQATSCVDDLNSVINVSPSQYGNSAIAAPSWFKQSHASGQLFGTILDDQMLIAPRTHVELYIRRDRVIMLINGEQRLCNDFPSQKLTMAEGALGFGQVLYHSSAERVEFSRSFNDRTGQRYYLQNTPFIDVRTWDNLGFSEHVGAPNNFDPSSCFTYSP